MTPARQRGFTLAELMIGSTLGLMILAGLLTFYTRIVTSSGDALRLAHLQQQLRATLEIMRHDLRRAGYYGQPPDTGLNALRSNPFTDADDPLKPATERNDIRTGHYERMNPFHREADDSCILYSYDLDTDGSLTPSGNGMERFGFRLRNGSLQMRYGGATFDCSHGSWSALTDSGIEITRLVFQLDSTALHPEQGVGACQPGEPCLYIRAVTIELAGRLRADHDVTLRLGDQVRLRNDRFLAALPPS